MENEEYGTATNEAPMDSGYALGKINTRNRTLREKLIVQKANYTQKLADVNAALEALDKNPNFEEVMNVIGKVS